MGNKITISGSVVGAMAIGNGAAATGSIGDNKASPDAKYAFRFEVKGATRAQIARWLRGVALVVEDPEHPVMSDAKTMDGASRAWTLEVE